MSDAFATGGPSGITAFYRSPRNTSDTSRSLVKQSHLHADKLSLPISQMIYLTGYERFKPNKGMPLVALGLPRLLAPVLPTTYSPRYLLLTKAYTKYRHSGSPYHTFVHCKGSAPAAPRRARASISVPFSGLGLSSPRRIAVLVGHYPTNKLIRRRPILKHRFSGKYPSRTFSLSGFTLSFPRLSQT